MLFVPYLPWLHDSGMRPCAFKMADTKEAECKSKDAFIWTDSELELLLESVKVFSSNCMFEGKDWEGIKSKYDRIRLLFTERYPSTASEEYPKSACLDTITKERIAAKLKCIRKNYKKAVDIGRRSGGGRVVMTFYDLCQEIWAGAPATKSIEGGIDSSIQSDNIKDDKISVIDEGDEKQNDRREKIEKFLKDDREKKMNHKIPVQTQQLNCMREDLALKRKVAEQSESTDKEYLSQAIKMSKTMETMAGAMTGCLQMMNAMFQMQANQQQFFPFGLNQNMRAQEPSPGMVVNIPFASNETPDLNPTTNSEQD